MSGLAEFDQEKRPYKSAVLCLCTPFIEYNPENDTFRPAHTSVYEFFDKEDDFQGASDLGICLRTAHREAASICLTYLSTFGLRTTVKIDTNLYPLVQYATKYWCHHLLMAQLDSDICSDAVRFLRSAPERRCWLERWLLMERDVFPLQQLMQLIKQVRDRLQVFTGDQQPDVFDYLQDILEILNGWDEYRLQQKSYDPAEQPAETQKLGIFERLVFVRELVREYTASSRLDDGVAQFQRAKCRLEQRPEVNPRDYTWLLNGLGLLYDQQQKTELALEVQKEALAIQLAAPFPNEFDMSLTTSELGRLHRHLGQYGESEKMHLQALKYLRSMFQNTEPQIIWTLNHLAKCYRMSGRLSEAEKLHRQAWNGRIETIGANHPHTLWTLSDLAKCLRDLRRLDEACQLQEDCTQRRKQTLGPKHNDTLWSLNDIGLMYEKAGRFGEALSAHREALEGQIDTLDREHSATIWSNSAVRRLTR